MSLSLQIHKNVVLYILRLTANIPEDLSATAEVSKEVRSVDD